MARYCTQCGAALVASFCSNCGAKPDPSAFELDPRVAGFGIRALAQILDTGVGFAVGAAAGFVAFVSLVVLAAPGTPDEWVKSAGSLSVSAVGASILGSILYLATSEYLSAATIGKLCCGLRVMSQDFGRVSLAGAIVRALVLPIDGLFLGVVAYFAMERSPLRQRVGDRWGRTVVVRKRAEPQAARGALTTLGGIVVALAVYTFVVAGSIVVRAWQAPGVAI